MHEQIEFAVKLGRYEAALTAFCRHVHDAFRRPEQISTRMDVLRREACKYQDRPSRLQLKFMLVCNVVLDLASHGWSVNIERGVPVLSPPDDKDESAPERKDRIRQKHLIERDAQLREPSVQQFVLGMERRRLSRKGWHSIYSVMRDGGELAASLRAALASDGEERVAKLKTVIDPYIQFVSPDAVCSETGLKLNDIWRYFRHTWVNVYKSVPGRNVMILIRDRARPNHPVIGIAALGSAVVQQGIRDKWIGWDTEAVVNGPDGQPSPKKVRCLIAQLRRFLDDIYTADLIRERFLTRADLRKPSDEVIRALRKRADTEIKLHRKNPEAAAHKKVEDYTNKDWELAAHTHLFRAKRYRSLAALLDAKRILEDKKVAKLKGKKLREVMQEGAVRNAFRRIVKFGKAERVGISMMDIMVCGAVAPYNAILGGKLACLLLCSPEIVKGYEKRYEGQVSVIASATKGRKVRRTPKLVLLCTTSLYGNGSSQYNRIKLGASEVGGHNGDLLRYEELGMSEGFGSFHFSKECVRIADALLGRSKDGRKVNSIFGEGVNPLMRKIREALGAVELPAEQLLNHGNKRILYGVPLAKNFREVLLGFDARARYIVPQQLARAGTANLTAFWMKRWLSRRIENPEVLASVAAHNLCYPIRHGAQVQLPGDDLPEMLKAMAASSA